MFSVNNKFNYEPRKFTLPTHDGFVINGYMSQGWNYDFPTVIVFGHGWNDGLDHNIPRDAAYLLASEGHTTVRYTSNRPIETCTVNDEARDVDTLMAALHYWEPQGVLGYAGHSRSMLAAFASRQLFDFAVSFDGSHPEHLRSLHPRWRLDDDNPDFSNDVTGWVAARNMWRTDWKDGTPPFYCTSEVLQSALAMDLPAAVRKFSGPVLYIAPTLSDLLPHHYELKLLSAHPETKVVLSEGASHNMTEQGAMMDSSRRIAEWLEHLIEQETLTQTEPDFGGEPPGFKF